MIDLKWTDGGVTFARGFSASGVHCGIRKNKSKRDLALIVCENALQCGGGVYQESGAEARPSS